MRRALQGAYQVCTDTPTVRHAEATACACFDFRPNRFSAACTVAVPNVANVAAAGSVGDVSTSYQTSPAPSHEVPPIPVAARQKARFGIPELMCTPPSSSVVSTYPDMLAGCGSLPMFG